MSLYVGLMSGTSMDAIDAVLCDIEPNRIDFMGAHSVAIPASLKEKLERACKPDLSVTHYHQLGREYAELCAQATHQLLSQTRTSISQVEALASHGQTLWHAPPKNDGETGFSIQLNDADWLAVKTGMPVIFDFRARDLALGGQGAP